MMVDEDIHVKSCKHLEFGNPSSHTYGVSCLYLTTAWLLIKHYTIKYKLEKSTSNKILFVVFNLIFFAIYIVGFSRVFLGVHTYN